MYRYVFVCKCKYCRWYIVTAWTCCTSSISHSIWLQNFGKAYFEIWKFYRDYMYVSRSIFSAPKTAAIVYSGMFSAWSLDLVSSAFKRRLLLRAHHSPVNSRTSFLWRISQCSLEILVQVFVKTKLEGGKHLDRLIYIEITLLLFIHVQLNWIVKD